MILSLSLEKNLCFSKKVCTGKSQRKYNSILKTSSIVGNTFPSLRIDNSTKKDGFLRPFNEQALLAWKGKSIKSLSQKMLMLKLFR